MKASKQIFFISMAVLMVFPFVLTTNFYPFLRFGMYAEPVPEQVELFVLKYSTNDTQYKDFDTNIIGLDESMMNYTIRHHYYQGKMVAFQTKLNQSFDKSPSRLSVHSWQVWRKMVSATSQDSTLILSIPKL